MTQEQADKVIAFVKSGGLVKMRGHGYVDDFATVAQDDDQQWTIKSEVWAEEPLLNYGFYDLTFYRRVEKL